MRLPRVLVPVLTLALAAGCRDCGDPLLPQKQPTEQPDVFTQKGAARVDILWMIDNSGSMAAEQEKVADRFNQFFNQLIISQVDYHIGVITSDPSEGGTLRQYNGPAVENCTACRFITKDVPCSDPSVDVSQLGSEAAKEARLAADCPAQLVFRRLIKVGVEGSSFEEGFTQAAAALGARNIDANGFPDHVVPEGNEGFARDDASLYIVFVSDEEEGAKADGSPVRYYQRLFEGLKAAGNENNVAVAAITGYPTDNPPAPIDKVCEILATTFDNNPGNDDVRAAAVKEALRDFNGNGCLDVEAGPQDDAAFAELGGRYIELACRTGGVIANMCEADYSTALDALGANAAGLLRKFTISAATRINGNGDCVIFDGGDEINIDCDGDGKQDGALDGPMCVKAQCIGQSAPTLQPRGEIWEWEQATSSVRFGGACIPAPNTEVIITYGVLPEGSTCDGAN